MSLSNCLIEFAEVLRDFDTESLQPLVQRNIDQGMDAQAAEVAAIEEKLSELDQTEQVVGQEILRRYQEMDPEGYEQASMGEVEGRLFPFVEEAPEVDTEAEAAPTPDFLFQEDKLQYIDGMFSTVEKAVMEMEVKQWSQGKLAPGTDIYHKLKGTQGLKHEELNWVGLQEFLTLAPKAKFSRQDVLSFVRQNGIQIDLMYSDEDAVSVEDLNWVQQESEIDEATLESDREYETEQINDPLDEYVDSEQLFADFADEYPAAYAPIYQYVASAPKEIYESFFVPSAPGQERLFAETETPVRDQKYIDYIMQNMTQDTMRQLRQDREFQNFLSDYIEDRAQESAGQLADQVYTANYGTGFLEIRGSEAIGEYRVLNDGNEIRIESSFEDAREFAVDFALEQGLVDSAERNERLARWESYVQGNRNFDYDMYQEIKLRLPWIENKFTYEQHFPDENIVAFLRRTRRQMRVMDADAEPQVTDYQMVATQGGAPENLRLFIYKGADGTGELLYSEDVPTSFAGTPEQLIENARQLYGPDKVLIDSRTGNRIKLLENNQLEVTYKRPTKNTYYLDEMQSDWHQQGREKGYVTDEEIAQIEELRIEKDRLRAAFVKLANRFRYSTELYADENKDKFYDGDSFRAEVKEFIKDFAPDLESLNEMYNLQDNGTLDKYFNPTAMYRTLRGVESTHVEIVDSMLDYLKKYPDDARRLQQQVQVNASLTEISQKLSAIRGGVPDVPFKVKDEWLSLGLKRALIDAVNENAEAFAFPNSAVLVDRYNEEAINLYINQYDRKMPSLVQNLVGTKPQFVDYADQSQLGDRLEPGYYIVELTPEFKQRVKEEGFSLFQDRRGEIELRPDNERIIRMYNASDNTTFLHEAAHLFLEVEKQIAAEYGLDAEQETILKFLDLPNFDNIPVEKHELFAETFERYLGTGEAPSLKLRDAFHQFARWIADVYKRMGGVDTNLPDETKDMFARLIATQEEIYEASQEQVWDQMFRSKEQAGMTDKEWEEYQKQKAKRDLRAEADLFQKAIKQYVARRKKEWNDEKRPIVEREKDRLAGTPLYSAIESMRSVKVSGEDIDAIINQIPDKAQLNKAKGKFVNLRSKEGIPLAEVASAFGYDSSVNLVNDIVNNPSLTAKADQIAQQEMLEKYGDIFNDGSLEREVRDSLHNEEQAKQLLMELNALRRKTTEKQKIDQRILKAEAKNIVAKMTYKDMNPDKFERASIRIAKKIGAARTPDEAFLLKTQQLANHYLYKETFRAKARMEKLREYVKKTQQRTYSTSQVDGDYVNQIKLLANAYDMKLPAEREAAAENFVQFVIAQQRGGIDLNLLDYNLVELHDVKYDKDIEVERTKEFYMPIFSELTFADMESIVAQLSHLRTVGGRVAKEYKDNLEFERNRIQDQLRKKIDRDGVAEDPTESKARLDTYRMLESFGYKNLALRQIIRQADDGKETGAFYDSFFRRTKASDNEIQAAEERYVKALNVILKKYDVSMINDGEETRYIDDDLPSFMATAKEKISMALYWGTESSRERVRKTLGVEDEQVMKMLETMPREHLELVNELWQLNEIIGDDIFKAHIARTGAAPPKLQATPYYVNGVYMTGGHHRVFYTGPNKAPSIDPEQNIFDHKTFIPAQAGSAYARSSIPKNKRIDLNLDNLYRNIFDAAHYVGYSVRARELQTLYNSDTRALLTEAYGQEFDKAFAESVGGLTLGSSAPDNDQLWLRGSRFLRRNNTLMTLGLNVRNIIQQTVSAYPALVEGGRPYLQSSAEYMRDPQAMKKFVHERSPQMRNRDRSLDREHADLMRQTSTGGRYEKFINWASQNAFKPQIIIDNAIAIPLWHSTYFYDLERTGDEELARNNADDVIGKTVGSGTDINSATWFRSNQQELIKIMVYMGGWFSGTVGQRAITALQRKNGRVEAILVTPFVMAAISALLVADFPGPEDEEQWLEWAMKKYGSFITGPFPIIRDFFSMAVGFTPKSVPMRLEEKSLRLLEKTFLDDTPFEEQKYDILYDVFYIGSAVAGIPGFGTVLKIAERELAASKGQDTSLFEADSSLIPEIYRSLVEGSDKNR